MQTVTVRFRVFDALDASSTVTRTVTLTSACSTSSNAFFTTTMDVAATYEDDSEKVLSNALFAAIAGEVQDDVSKTLDQLLDAQSRLDLDDSTLLKQEALLATYLLANGERNTTRMSHAAPLYRRSPYPSPLGAICCSLG